LLPILTLIVDTAVKLRKDGHRVCIVSSGAIGVGLRRMDVEKRPKHLAQLQVSASPYTRVLHHTLQKGSQAAVSRHWQLLVSVGS
jgi:glutamate 5-kinase